jgi:glycosyltransferase involved in cell wall biosynthesis
MAGALRIRLQFHGGGHVGTDSTFSVLALPPTTLRFSEPVRMHTAVFEGIVAYAARSDSCRSRLRRGLKCSLQLLNKPRPLFGHNRQVVMKYTFSLVVPSFNREELLRETIDSVLSQTFRDFELIVVDDGSTDGTWCMLQQYGTRVRALRQANQGPEVARNLGASQAAGEYIALLDSDDLLLPHALAVYDQVIRVSDSPALVIGVLDFFVHGQRKEVVAPDFIEAWKYSDYLSKDVAVGLSSSNIVIRKSVFDSAGGFRNSTPTTYHADTFAIVLRFGTSGPCVVLNQPPTVAYRKHATNTVHDVEGMISGMLSLIEEERQGQYPGGRPRRFDRYACLGGMSLAWVKYAMKARKMKLALKLLVNSSPMVGAGILKKVRSRFGPATPVIRIGNAAN